MMSLGDAGKYVPWPVIHVDGTPVRSSHISMSSFERGDS